MLAERLGVLGYAVCGQLRALMQKAEALVVLAILGDDHVLISPRPLAQEVIVFDSTDVLQVRIIGNSRVNELSLLAIELKAANEVMHSISWVRRPANVLSQASLELLISAEPLLLLQAGTLLYDLLMDVLVLVLALGV